MRPSHVREALHHLVRIRQPVFLWGPPGVGKSRLVADVARRQGRRLHDLRAVLLDPVDLRGLPRISDEGITSWCVPEFLPHPQDTDEGILFLDELNAAPPLVQAACYQLVLDRRVGQYRLPDGWAQARFEEVVDGHLFLVRGKPGGRGIRPHCPPPCHRRGVPSRP